MSARPGAAARAPAPGTLARLQGWLVEPAARPEGAVVVPLGSGMGDWPPRPLVAVVGLSPRCGATTLARALGACLARRDHAGAALVTGAYDRSSLPLAVRGAARLAARLPLAAPARASGRLCLVDTPDYAGLAARRDHLAPVVLDVPRDRSPDDAVSLADLAVLVAPGHAEPALAELAAAGLERPGRAPLIVVNRAADPSPWHGRAFAVLPESRVGARLAARGWEARGPYATAVALVADSCEASV